MHLSIASPGVIPGRPQGFYHFVLPRGGEFDHKVGYGVGTHWPTPVYTAIYACSGMGMFD